MMILLEAIIRTAAFVLMVSAMTDFFSGGKAPAAIRASRAAAIGWVAVMLLQLFLGAALLDAVILPIPGAIIVLLLFRRLIGRGKRADDQAAHFD